MLHRCLVYLYNLSLQTYGGIAESGHDSHSFIQCVRVLVKLPLAVRKPSTQSLWFFVPGFTLEPNPADVLMVACPLPPPAEWDDVLGARVALLRRRGLQPQLFLSAAALPPPPAAAAGEAC